MKIHDRSKEQNVKGITVTYADNTTKTVAPYPPTPDQSLELVKDLAERRVHSFAIHKERRDG